MSPSKAEAQDAEIQNADLAEASRLFGQVIELHAKGMYDQAIPLAKRSLLLLEKRLDPNHPNIASVHNYLGLLFQAKDDLKQAEISHKRALAIRQAVFNAGHPEIAQSLMNLALVYQAKGDYAQAETHFQRALTMLESALPPDDPAIAIVLDNYGDLSYLTGKYTQAEKQFQRARAIFEKARTPDEPWIARSLNHLAQLYQSKGDYEQSEQLYQSSLAIRERVLDPGHPEIAQSLHNLASLYRAKGEYLRAEPLLLRALDIVEKLGPRHSIMALVLNNLGGLYQELRNYTKAESLYLRVIDINENVFGPDHLRVSYALSDLGLLYRAKGDYARAEPLLRRALSIVEKALKPDHPEIGVALNNLGLLFHEKGDYPQAEQFYYRSLAIKEKAFGPTHPSVALQLNNLGFHYYERGDLANAVKFLRRGNDVLEHNLARVISTGSERQKLAFIATLSGVTHTTISLQARSAPSDPQALQLALTTVLRRKGRALDTMSDQIASLRTRLNQEDRALLDKLSVAQTQLASLALGGLRSADPEGYKAIILRLADEVERLQESISRRSAEFRVQTNAVTVDQVQQALPAGAALVDFFSYETFEAKRKTRTEQWGATRYVVYVLPKKGAPLWADLGEAKNIDEEITHLLVALRCPQTVDNIRDCPAIPKVKQLARNLDERLMRPVRKLLGNTRHIFISPDGALNLLPFATLVDENNKYLIENYSFTYLTSGRELLRFQLSAESKEPPLIVADPAFSQAASQASATVRWSEITPSKRSIDMMEVNFKRLSGTAAEASELTTLLPRSRILMQTQATESAVKRVRSPSVLHIATHGFFLPDQPSKPVDDQASSSLTREGVGPRLLLRSENPLLRSGLALAGANLPPINDALDDGILTALETAGLDLWGTKLVVLSACETGVGQVSNGNGVYGLRRALVLAGSESQVMSLWQVSDVATKNLMVGYYRRLLGGEGRTEALRQVQLGLLRNKRKQTHPYYWAAFIQSGDWRSLN